jgi:hypothetical protein
MHICKESPSALLPRGTNTAERALASFYVAVAERYGEELAAEAARDWIESLEKSCMAGRSDWRAITIAAAGRLARRLEQRSRPAFDRAG